MYEGVAVLLSFIASGEILYVVGEQRERREQFAAASEAAWASGKPLLVIGRPKGHHICGAVTVDINPRVLMECPGTGRVADVRSLPFPDGAFGAAIASHVLEHLPISDIPTAWSELHRVSDAVFVAGPKPSPLQWLFFPQHTCLCYQLRDGSIEVRDLVTARALFRLAPPTPARLLSPSVPLDRPPV